MRKFKAIVSLVFSVVVSIFMNSCSSYENEDGSIDYIPVKLDKDGYWSLMGKDGKILYENEFKESPSAVYNGFFYVKEGDYYSVYEAKENKPKLVKGMENLTSVGLFKEGLMPVCFKDKRISVVDENGNVKFELSPIKGNEILGSSIQFCDGMLCVVDEDNKVGYFNTIGECVITPKYDKGGDFFEDKAVVCKDSEWRVINKKGETLFSLKKGLEPIFWRFIDNKLCVRDENGAYYFYDEKGDKTKLSSKIKNIMNYRDGYITYCSDSEDRGLMKEDGEVIIRPKYQGLGLGEKGQLYAILNDDKGCELLDYNGDIIKSIDYTEIYYFNGFGYVALDKSGGTILNKKGEPIAKNVEFESLGELITFNIIVSNYSPIDNIISEVVELINPNGVENYKFGDIEGSTIEKKYVIVSPSSLTFDDNIDVFTINSKSNIKFYNKDIDGLIDAFKKKGFVIEQEESNNSYKGAVLKKDGKYLFVTNYNEELGLNAFYLKNYDIILILKERLNRIKNNMNPNEEIDKVEAIDTAYCGVETDSIVDY